jgi:hypothetical protein
MRHLFTLLLVTLCAATSYGQTIKSLGYTTNGQIVAATNVVWTNAFSFSTNTVAAQVRTNLGLGATWLTNTNATNFRTAIGLGVSNVVLFEQLFATDTVEVGSSTNTVQITTGAIEFGHSGIAAATRTNLGLVLEALTNSNVTNFRAAIGLPLPALTNTSSVTTMRALAGSTNTNAPFSGTLILANLNQTEFQLVISNGIIVSVQEL